MHDVTCIVATSVNTNSITVDFSGSAASGVITAQENNGCGDGIISANFIVTICTSSGIYFYKIAENNNKVIQSGKLIAQQ